MIPHKEWEWFGHPQHFIGAADCGFRMGTRVGQYIISTVGEYAPNVPAAPGLDGTVQDIGYHRKYETMVFKIDGDRSRRSECGCPAINAKSATVGHMLMCQRYAELQEQAS